MGDRSGGGDRSRRGDRSRIGKACSASPPNDAIVGEVGHQQMEEGRGPVVLGVGWLVERVLGRSRGTAEEVWLSNDSVGSLAVRQREGVEEINNPDLFGF